MTEGEVCLNYAKMAETQRQTQLDRTSAVKNPLLKRNRCLWLYAEGHVVMICADFRRNLGYIGYYNIYL